MKKKSQHGSHGGKQKKSEFQGPLPDKMQEQPFSCENRYRSKPVEVRRKEIQSGERKKQTQNRMQNIQQQGFPRGHPP
jgi:hypothetical protein